LFEAKQPPDVLFRIGRQPDPWQPPDWSRASPDGTFGNRFDDPQGNYRVLYAASQELSCYVETLARFRLDLALLAELKEIEGDDDFFPPFRITPIDSKYISVDDPILREALELLGLKIG
jgi:hypothetical protein